MSKMWWRSKSSVVDSQAEDGNTIRRRRNENAVSLLPERVEERTLVVVKKDGTREQFSRDKIFINYPLGLKRPVSDDEIEEIVNRIEQRFAAKESDNEINQ